jgi:hypothetical protein
MPKNLKIRMLQVARDVGLWALAEVPESVAITRPKAISNRSLSGQNRSLRNCTRNCITKNLGTHALLRLETELKDYLSAIHLCSLITFTASATVLVNLRHDEEIEATSEPFRVGKIPHGMLESWACRTVEPKNG